MSINQSMLQQAQSVLAKFSDVKVSGMYLPPVKPGEFCDEFGFIQLNSGAIGP